MKKNKGKKTKHVKKQSKVQKKHKVGKHAKKSEPTRKASKQSKKHHEKEQIKHETIAVHDKHGHELIKNFFNAKSIAVIGASRTPEKIGHVILKNLLDGGFRGFLYPINPNADNVLGIKAHKSVLSIEDPIDLAVIAVQADIAIKVAEECGKKGIKNLVIVSSGFAEEGFTERDKKLRAVLDKYQIKLIGPNCVSGDTPLLITNDDRMKFFNISELVDKYMDKFPDKIIRVNDTYLLDTKYIDKELRIASFQNGEPCFKKIKHLMKRNAVRDSYKIILYGGREIVCSEDHPFVITKNNEWMKIPAKALKVGDLVPTTVGMPSNNNYITEINILDHVNKIPLDNQRIMRFLYGGKCFSLDDIRSWSYDKLAETKIITIGKTSIPVILPITKELCELIGFFIADGSYKSKTCIIGFIGDKEAELNLRRSANKIFSSKLLIEQKKCIKFGGHIGKILFEHVFGIGKGVENKKVPNFLFACQHDKIASFLSGLYDGDGGIHIKKNRPSSSIYFNTISQRIRDQVLMLLGILDVGPFYVTKIKREGIQKKGTFQNAKDMYEIRTDSKQAIAQLHAKGFNFLGAKNSRLILTIENRKNYSRRSKDNILLKPIKSIERINELIDLYDFEVEDSHVFFAGQILTSNCLGIYDAHTKLDTLFLPRYRLQRPQEGGIAFISQSGAVGSAIMDYATERGYGFSKFISYGNAMNTDETDFLAYLGEDEKTKVICMYIEDVKDGRKFIKIATDVSKKKPVIVIKGGRTKEGSAAAHSHTGALAGSAKIYSDIFRQCNIIEADTLEELFEYAKMLEKSKVPSGNKIHIITNGGGYGIIATDAAVEEGLTIAKLSSDSKKQIKKLGLTTENPLDLLGDANNERYKKALEIADKDKNVDIILVIILYQTPLVTTDMVNIISEFSTQSKKPLVAVSTGGEFTELLGKRLEEQGVPVYSFPLNAVRSIAKMVQYYKRR